MKPRTPDEDHPRDRLIAAATGMFHDLGYHSVGVQALCEQADVAKGSFYHFFESKEDLTIAVVDRAWRHFKDGVIDPVIASALSPRERLDAIRRACVENGGHATAGGGLPHSCLFGRLAAGLTDSESALRARIAVIFTEWAGLLATAGECDIDQGWAILAEIQGRLVLGFAVHGAAVTGS